MAAKKKKISKPKAVAKGKKPAAKMKPAKAPEKTALKKVAAKTADPKKPFKKMEPVKKPNVAKKIQTEPVADSPAPAAAGGPAVPDGTEPEEVVLTDADGRRYCRVKDCDQIAVVDTYCRYHYLMFWKKIQVRKKILSEGKLERYIEELTARYPDKFLDMLRKDLRSEKEFLAAIQELEIDEAATENEFEDEAQTYIDEVRGISETAPVREEEEF